MFEKYIQERRWRSYFDHSMFLKFIMFLVSIIPYKDFSNDCKLTWKKIQDEIYNAYLIN